MMMTVEISLLIIMIFKAVNIFYVVNVFDGNAITDDFSIVSQVPPSPAFAIYVDPSTNATVLITPDGLDRETTALYTILLK